MTPLFALLLMLVMGVGNAWADTATLNSSSNKGFGSTSGITFSISGIGNWTGANTSGTSRYKHCAGYQVNTGASAVVTWSGVASGKCIKISSVTLKATVESGSVLNKNQKMRIYTSVSGDVNTKQISSSGNTSAQSVSITEDGYLKEIGNGGSITMISNDQNWYIESLTITYTIEELPKFTFSLTGTASPTAGGKAQVSFDGTNYTDGSKSTTTIGAKFSTSSASATAYFKAVPADGYQFVKWSTNSSGTDNVSTNNPYSVGLSNTTSGSTTSKSLYAIFDNKVAQTITWNQTISNQVRGNEITLNGTANSGLTVSYTASPSDLVSISGNKVTCLKAGDVTITAHQSGNASYYAASDVVGNTFTIAEHAITKNPTAKGITYEQKLSDATLSGGTANVAGTWAWKTPNTVPDAGIANYVAVFTPSSSIISGEPLECNVSVEVAKATPDVTCNIADNYMVDADALDLQSIWTREGNGAITYSCASFTPSGSNNGGATAPVVTSDRYLSLGQAGTLRVQMAIAEGTNYKARTVTKDLTIHKYTSTFENVANITDVKVEASKSSSYTLTYTKPTTPASIVGTNTIAAGTPGLNSTSGDFYYTLAHEIKTDNQAGCPEAYKDVVITYDAANKSATGRNKGTATIHLYQKETYKYNANDASFTVSVEKNDNTISCNWGTWTKTLNFDEGAYTTFSSNNELTSVTPIVVVQKTGSQNGTYYPDPTNYIYASYNNNTTATWSVNQAENYKYNKAAEKTVTINVQTQSQPTCDVTLFTALTDGSKKVSETSDFDLGGVGLTLHLHIKTNGLFGNDAKLYYKTASEDWTYLKEVSAPAGGEDDRSVDLPEGTTHIKFMQKSTDDPYISNIRVTRTKYFDIENAGGSAISELTMPQNVPGGTVKKATFYVDYSTCADTIRLVSSHSRIKFTASNSTTYKFATGASKTSTADRHGRKAIEVSYTSSSSAEELHEKITIYTPYDNKVLNINAETAGKLTTTLHYKGAASYSVDAANIAATDLFEVKDENNDVVANPVITLATGASSIIAIATGNKAIDPQCGGSATITASYAGDATHEAASSVGQSITIDRLNDTINWDNSYASMVVGEELDIEQFGLSAVSGLDITLGVTTATSAYLEVKNGKVIAKAKGNGRLKATTPGDCTYKPCEGFQNITVRRPEDPCGSTLLYKSTTLKVGALGEHTGTVFTLKAGEPDTLTCKVWKYSNITTQYAKLIFIDKDDKEITSETYEVGSLPTSEPDAPNVIIDLKEDKYKGTKKIKVDGDGTLNKYIKELRVSQKAYVTASTSSVKMTTVKACETATGQFTVSYSDVSRLQLTQTNNAFTYEVWEDETKLNDFANDCKGFGTYTIKFSYTPQAKGDFSNTVTISASGKSAQVVLSGTANKPDRTIVWDIPTANTITATQSVDLTAYVETSCQSPAGAVYYTCKSETPNAAVIDGDLITFNKAATVTVTAHSYPSDDYNDAPTVDKVWSVGKVGVQMRTLPTITSTITYGDAKSVVSWDDKSWVAEDTLVQNEVAGSIAYVSPDNFMAAGKTNLTFNFTPSNVNIYDVLQFTVPVTVQKAETTLSWTANPSSVTYGNTATYTASSESDGEVTYSISDGAAYASIDANTGVLTVLEAGHNVTVQASQAAGTNYVTPQAISTTVTLNKAETTLSWTANPSSVTYGNTATYTAGSVSDGAISYSIIQDDNYASIDANGVLTVIEAGHTITVQALQAAGTNYVTPQAISTTVTVDKATPVMTAKAVEVTYGTAPSSVEPETESGSVSGEWSWTDENSNSTTLTAGNYDMDVHFTPTGDDANNYNALDTKVAVTVNKANTTLVWTNAPENVAHNATGVTYAASSASDGAITYSITAGGLYAHIDSESGELTIDVPGNTITIQASQAEGTNHNAPSAITVDVTIAAIPADVFTNAGGDNEWSNPQNWEGGVVPTGDPDVIIKGALEISGGITVGDLTIENTGSVAVVTNGILRVKGMSESRSEYGDMHVLNDGKVVLENSADLQVRHFTLDAALGDNTDANPGASGQVSGEGVLDINGDAYFQMSFDVTGQITYGWYDFAVPFEVEAANGVFDSNGTKIQYGKDYLIQDHSESRRANGQKGWANFTGTMQPGRIYTITLDDEQTWNTFLFKKKAGSEAVNEGEYQSEYTAVGETYNRGWNGFGNGTLQHREVSSTSGFTKVQIYNHTNNCYDAIDDLSEKAFAVGTSFSFQVESAQSVVFEETDGTKALRAPAYGARSTEEFRLALTDETTLKVADHLWISASEEATGEYRIGHDLLKMGTPTKAKSAQMWSTNNGLNLCDVELPLVNDEASCSLGLFAPKAGVYTLEVERQPEDVALYLTYNDQVIWDLTMSAYELDLSKGSTDGYGLRIEAKRAPQITTGVDEINGEAKQARKVLVNDRVYVITPEGKMYDIVGKSVKY